MQKTTIILLFLLSSIVSKAQLYGDFPYNQPFNSTTAPSEILLPTGSGANNAAFTTNGLRLTTATNNLFGAAIINNRQFSSINGIHIEFEYSMYDGTTSPADGLSVFLFDAAVTPIIGATGAGLGYAYNRANNTYPSFRTAGLAGAYLGIGFDYYGNFKTRRFQGESLRNGVPTTFVGSDQVTLRAARGTSANTSPATPYADGYSGYPVLISKSTTGTVNSSTTLDVTTGSYTTGSGSGGTSLRGGAYTTDPTNAAFRKAYIDLIPSSLGGYNVTVKIQSGSTINTIINNYHYPLSVVYVENANGNDSGTGAPIASANTTHTLTTTPPTSFKIGFAASTGGLNQVQSIRNLKVTLPFSAEAYNDASTVCSGSSKTFDVLSNDIAYTGTIPSATGSSSNIDKSSFRFVDASGNVVAGTTYTDTNGVWSYNTTTGLVTFQSNTGYVGTESVQYTIKGTTAPFNDEGYRSQPATITMTSYALPTVPNIAVTAPTCGADGTATISNYSSANTYTFAPTGPIVNGTGLITGLVANTNYVVTSTNSNSCTASNSFSVFQNLNLGLDSDGDTISNTCDLDDDNDGILDTVEGLTCSVEKRPTSVSTTATNLDSTLALTNTIDGNQSTYAGTPINTSMVNGTVTYSYSTPITTTLINKFRIFPNGGSIQTDGQVRKIASLSFYNSSGALLHTITNIIVPQASSLSPGNYYEVDLPYLNNVSYFVMSGIEDTGPVTGLGLEANWRDITLYGCSFLDTDGDSIPNHLDLDSDGDGCPDAIEGAGSILYSQLASNTSVGGAVNTTAGAASYGVPLLAGNGQAIGTSTNSATSECCTASSSGYLDSDGDNVSNVCDLDDDNDGVLDTSEGCYNTEFAGDNTTATGVPNAATLGYDFNNSTNATTQMQASFAFIGPAGGNIINVTQGTSLSPMSAGAGLTSTYQSSVSTASGALNLNGIDSATLTEAKANNEYLQFSFKTTNNNLNAIIDWFGFYNSVTSNPNFTVAFEISNDGFSSNSTQLGVISQIAGERGTLAWPNGRRNRKNVPYKLVGNTTYTVRMYFYGLGTATSMQYDDVLLGFDFCSKDTDSDGVQDYLDLDSDNDGCLDAIEGGASITSSQLVTAGGTVTVGTGSNASNQNLCAGTGCVNTQGVPQFTTLPTNYSNTAGQGVGTSQNQLAVECATAFTCNNTFYVSQSASASTATTLYTINTSANPFTFTAIGDNSHGYIYNAMGFKTSDGFIYAMRYDASAGATVNNQLLKISSDGKVYNLGAVPSLPGGVTYDAGAFDSAGNYFIRPTNSSLMYKIDVSTRTLLSTINLVDSSSASVTVNTGDLAYNVSDSMFYGVDSITSKLVKINPSTGLVTYGTATTNSSQYGAMWGSGSGHIYGSANDGTEFAQFNATSGASTKISNVPSTVLSDGASCLGVTTVLALSTDLQITKTNGVVQYTPGTNTTYTIEVKNNGLFGVVDAVVTDALPTGITTMSYYAVASSGSTTNVTGTSTSPQTGAINDKVSLPVGGTVTYTVTVAIPSSFSGDLVNTATITAPSTATETLTTNNTATDTDSGVCYNAASTVAATGVTNHGITLLQKAGANNGNWPMSRNSAHTVLESNTKGFVITRMTTAQISSLVAVEGMMVYDTNLKCLKLYDGTAWSCFTTPACP